VVDWNDKVNYRDKDISHPHNKEGIGVVIVKVEEDQKDHEWEVEGDNFKQ